MICKLQMLNRYDLKAFIWFLVILKNVAKTIEHDYMDTPRTEKQMSLESCLGRFDVHTNTIIRTGESQAIGGKFLQGLELETPEKCQRLCCETSDCDVYVFEEKNDGYCYLFQCGSPKNFHCKFTRHPNYTSALITTVLTTTPRPSTHVFLTNISTQEQELISLKLKPDRTVLTTTQLPLEAAVNESRQMTVAVTQARNSSCGRFEFSCHSGECIAVYNACNGIPQCADGSDEGPECSAGTNVVKSNAHQLDNLKPDIVQQQVPAYRPNVKNFPQDVIDVPFIDHRESSNMAPVEWVGSKGQANMQVDLDRTTFGSIKVQPKNIMNLDEPEEKQFPNQREMYALLPAIKSSFPTPRIVQPTAHVFVPNVRWPSQQQQWQIMNQGQPIHEHIHPDAEENHVHTIIDEQTLNADPRLTNDNSVQKTKPESIGNMKDKSTDYAEYAQKGRENSKQPSVAVKHETTKSLTALKEASHPSAVEQYKIIEQNLEMKFEDHDGHSERPSGAVLSLTLGLLVTGVIVILIGCRLRTVGRRGNRHGGKVTYAPDEDFLVNGMYL